MNKAKAKEDKVKKKKGKAKEEKKKGTHVVVHTYNYLECANTKRFWTTCLIPLHCRLQERTNN